MKTIVIQLDAHDDLISVRDKMVWSKAQRILLVWPKNGRPDLIRTYDLVSLQRHAIELGAQLGLVTHDLVVNANARDLGIAAFRSSKQAQRQHWQRKRSPKPFQRGEEKLDRLTIIMNSRANQENPQFLLGWSRLAIFTTGVLAVLVMGIFLLPGATVILKPIQKDQNLSMNLIVDPKLAGPSPNGQIPAETVSTVVEIQGQIGTSGKASIPDQKARGLVTLTNLTNRSRILPAGRVISALEPLYIQFSTTQEAILAAGVGNNVEVSVVALEGGTAGNLKANAELALEGSMGPDMSVANSKAFTGGTDQTLPAVTQADYDKLRRQLIETLKINAQKDLESSLGDDKTLLAGTLTIKEILQENLLPEVGSPGDELTLNLQAVVSALAVADQYIDQFAQAALDAKLAEGQLAVPLSLSIKPAPGVVQQADGQLELNIIASRKTVPDLSKGPMLNAVLGKRPETAKRNLSDMIDLKEPPQINLMPSWWFWMPSIGFRIQFEVQ
ncbi:MAG TPA: baseplate J/gp47 family protein [Longilinea sp.]|nr:baseplate J/gp47 family protein [Longilinea sp.]